ncbi:G:T/U mismatch-specific DNA glycosylase [Desulfosporosinus acidiphilus SJ4]|uniref:G:T/U mismatch-specific DNA glycosylase n=1 Tax=Desulfosporosinus acidiphilus (strain DSM 22704 / JCM 16185 / SJ4) TaxID=646529 RepID=I4D4P6_DESAJ|nr:DNA-deoxyinosine glycosylase [Desulfosporosinus acidiphilus]AFM40770.1 G:T/U mismatch-specific DNA glycosylase [Desulfosporosinus acidiphilus SJ4]
MEKTPLHSFQPIIDSTSRILILGSMPGVQSLKEQRYYANPQNQFWRILYTIFSVPFDSDYQQRISFIRSQRIALWDVIATCHREGSLDSNIKDERVNDFHRLFETCTALTLVLFNGAKAYEIFKKRVGFNFSNLSFRQLPSTSPANTIKLEEKINQWAIIREFLAREFKQ